MGFTGSGRFSDSPLFRQPVIQTTQYSDSPLFWQPVFPTRWKFHRGGYLTYTFYFQKNF